MTSELRALHSLLSTVISTTLAAMLWTALYGREVWIIGILLALSVTAVVPLSLWRLIEDCRAIDKELEL